MEAQTLTQAPERVLIAERKDRKREVTDSVQRIAEAAAQLATLYATLDLGEFDGAALADAYETGGDQTRRRYLDHAKAEAAKIESVILRRSMLASLEADTPPYFAKAKEIQANAGSEDRYLLGYMTATADGATLTNEDAERLADKYWRVYLTDPDEIAKYRQHEAAVAALNALFEDGKALPVLWFNIFYVGKGGKISIPEDGVNYAYLLRKRRETDGAAPQEQPQPVIPEAETQERQQPQQQNRKRGGIVKGITKPPQQHDRGAEMRGGLHKYSPDAI